MSHVLFICAGNVARSQMAEAYYNHFSDSNDASSAGLLHHTPARYGTPVANAVEVMLEDGIDISQQIVKTVTPNMVHLADAIYVLCPEERAPEFVTTHRNCHYWSISDPYAAPLGGFRQVRDQIKKYVAELLRMERGIEVRNDQFRASRD